VSVEYRVVDRSPVYAAMKRFVWTPMLAWVPLAVSANTLTLLGTGLAFAASALLYAFPDARASWGAAALLYFAFLCLDNLDGPQARRTGGGTPLGEMLDHWLDALSGGLIFAAALRALDVSGPLAWLLVGLAVLSYTATYWELRTTGRMVLAEVGNTEGLLAVSALCLAGALLGPEALRGASLFGWTLADVYVVGTVLTTLYTVAGPVVRVRRAYGTLAWLFAPYLALFGWAWAQALPSAPVVLLFVALAPATAGRMLLGRVLERPALGAEPVLCGGTVLAALACVALSPPPAAQAYALYLLLAYGAARTALDFRLAVRTLSHHLRPGELLALAMGRRAP
jgi:phosphatidylglycerophosphate synthase